MRYQTHSYETGSAPYPLKILIGVTVLVSLIGAFIPLLQIVLSLNKAATQHLFLWQPATYLLIHPSDGRISFPFLLHLAFNMYLLWTFGSSLILRSRPLLFFALYFGSGIFAALLALSAISLDHSPQVLAGSSTALYAVLISWVILNPEADLFLFFAIPLKARHLLLALIGANLLIDLSNRDWISMISYTASALFGYLFTLITWRELSPFPPLHPFERALFRTLDRLAHIGKRRHRPSKIYDIHSGNPIPDDDRFMDAMLARISLQGEESLTPAEKQRMKAISARKAAKRK